MPNTEDQADLVTRFQNGDTEAFGHLYDHFFDNIYRYFLSRVGNRETALDLTQDTFEQAFKNLSKTRLQSSFAKWLFGIANHKVTDHYRRDARWKEVEAKMKGSSQEDDYEDVDEQFEVHNALEEILNQLSDNQQAVIELRRLQGVSVGEMAAIRFGEDTPETRRKISKLVNKAMRVAKKVGKKYK